MKVLIFSDIHGDLRALARIVEQPADVYIAAGDLATFRKGLDRCGKVLKPLGERLWVLPGNHETHDDIREFCRRFGFVDFHRRVLQTNSTPWAGLGYSNITPFKTPGEYSEEEIAEALAPFDGIAGLHLVVHFPPYGTRLDEYACLLYTSVSGKNRYEFVLPKKDGSRVPVIISARMFEDPDGLEFSVVTFTDISEQKSAEADLRQANARLKERQSEIDEDLLLAARVQQSLAPESLVWGGMRVDAYFHPVRSIGGDFGLVKMCIRDRCPADCRCPKPWLAWRNSPAAPSYLARGERQPPPNRPAAEASRRRSSAARSAALSRKR